MCEGQTKDLSPEELAKAVNTQRDRDWLFEVKVSPVLDRFSGRRIRVTYEGPESELPATGRQYKVEALKDDGSWERLPRVKHITIDIDAKEVPIVKITTSD